jgi:hypothetical protein
MDLYLYSAVCLLGIVLNRIYLITASAETVTAMSHVLADRDRNPLNFF